MSLRPPGFDHDGPALDVAVITQGLPECVEARRSVCESAGAEVADTEDLARLFRVTDGLGSEQADDKSDGGDESSGYAPLP